VRTLDALPLPDSLRARIMRVHDRVVETHRRLLYERPPLLSSVRKHALMLRHRHATITIDTPVWIGRGFSVHMPGAGELHIGPHVELRRNTRIEIEHGGRVVIGARTQLTYDVVIQCTQEVTIGEGCLLANGASVVDSKHRFRDAGVPIREQGLDYGPVHIGDHVWVSSKATVAADVGDHSVVAAHAVVTKPVPPRSLAAGVPARVIEELEPAPEQSS
jgi:acetyltransferase-like isoleucine patch superfamily enzyme